jgi:hypothetical protein
MGSIAANREVKIITRLAIWVEDQDLGEVFSSRGGFKLPNSAVRSPDVAFVAKECLPLGWRDKEDSGEGYRTITELCLILPRKFRVKYGGCGDRSRGALE